MTARLAASPSLLRDVSGYKRRRLPPDSLIDSGHERRRLPPDLPIYSGYETRRLCPGDGSYPPVMNAGSLSNEVMCFSARYVPVSLSLSTFYVCYYYGIITK
jgi:hypothetical protein